MLREIDYLQENSKKVGLNEVPAQTPMYSLSQMEKKSQGRLIGEP